MRQKSHLYRGDSLSNYLLLNQINGRESLSFSLESNLANERIIESVFSATNHLSGFDIEANLFEQGDNIDAVSFLPVDRLVSSDEKDNCTAAFSKVMDSGRFTSGPYVTQLQNELVKFIGINEVVLCSSGTDAMVIALVALGVQSGDEVIMPANSFAATENAVISLGAIPVLVDVNQADYLVNAEEIEKLISSKTKLIMPVGLYGQRANVKAIREVADQYSIKVLEDACQNIGVTGLGSQVDAAILSFNPYKNFGVFGKAGAIMTNDPELAKKCRSISYHGFKENEKNIKSENFGFNSQMDNLQAAIGLARLPFLSLNNFKRLYLAHRYVGLLADLAAKNIIHLPEITANHVWHLFPMRVADISIRDKVIATLQTDYGVETDVYYKVLSHKQQTSFKTQHFAQSYLPKTELLHQGLINLPLHPNLTIQEQNKVVESLYAVFR